MAKNTWMITASQQASLLTWSSVLPEQFVHGKPLSGDHAEQSVDRRFEM